MVGEYNSFLLQQVIQLMQIILFGTHARARGLFDKTVIIQ